VDQTPWEWSDSQRVHPPTQPHPLRVSRSPLTVGKAHGKDSWQDGLQVNNPQEMHLSENHQMSLWADLSHRMFPIVRHDYP
jgi:hypothetical protein